MLSPSYKKTPYQEKVSSVYSAMKLSSLGIELVLSILLGLGAGYFLDRKLGTMPWLTLVGMALGMAAATKSLLMAHKKMKEALAAPMPSETPANEASKDPASSDSRPSSQGNIL